MLRIEPVDRLSITSTSYPSASSVSARCEPMKPAPPVINALTRSVLSVAGIWKRADGPPNALDILGREPRMERQRHDFSRNPLRHRAFRRVPCAKRRLLGDRDRIMHEGFDARGLEMGLKRRSLR